MAKGARAGEDADAPPEIPPEVQARVIRDLLDRHYHRWPDESLPALAGKTPRQAAADPQSRKPLIDTLKDMERNEERMSRSKDTPPYDFAWLWNELGIERDV